MAAPGGLIDHGQSRRTARSPQLLRASAMVPSVVVDLDAAVAFAG